MKNNKNNNNKNNNNKNRNKRGLLCIITGLLAIDAALFLAMFNIYQDFKSGQSASIVLAQLDTSDSVVDSTDDNSDMPTELIGDYEYIGELTIPALDLQLPIISEWNYKALKIAPCRYTGSVYTDDLIIAAHNYTTHFGRLKELSIGDEVDFTDLNGETYVYKVAEKEILKPTAVEEMESDEWDLTLFTCTIGGKSRVTIRCERVQ
jgi:sortase A